METEKYDLFELERQEADRIMGRENLAFESAANSGINTLTLTRKATINLDESSEGFQFGDIEVFEKDDNCFFEWRIFMKLVRQGRFKPVASAAAINSFIERIKREIFDKGLEQSDKYKVFVTQIDGKDIEVIHEAGFYKGIERLAASHGHKQIYRNAVVEQSYTYWNDHAQDFQKKLREEVLPSLRQYGRYPPPNQVAVKNETDLIINLATTVIETRREQIKLAREQEKLAQEQKRLAIEQEKLTKRQDNMDAMIQANVLAIPNKIEYMTARQFLLHKGEAQSFVKKYAKPFGGACFKEYRQSGGKYPSPEKIIEGTYNVNQWPVEILEYVYLKRQNWCT